MLDLDARMKSPFVKVTIKPTLTFGMKRAVNPDGTLFTDCEMAELVENYWLLARENVLARATVTEYTIDPVWE